MFEEIDELAERLRASAPPGPDRSDSLWFFQRKLADEELLDQLVALGHVIAAAEAQRMIILAEMAERAVHWVDDEHIPGVARLGPEELAAEEVAPALRLSPITAASRVHRARRIASRLPGTLRALAAGDLDLGRVLAIDEATSPLSDSAATAVEQAILPEAPHQTGAELRAALRRAVIAADPDGAEQRRRAAVRDRGIQRWSNQDGTGTVQAVLSAIDSGEIYDLIDDVARHTKIPDDRRSIDARRADALVMIMLGRAPHLGPEDPPQLPLGEPPADGLPPDDLPPDNHPADDPPRHDGPADDQPPGGSADVPPRGGESLDLEDDEPCAAKDRTDAGRAPDGLAEDHRASAKSAGAGTSSADFPDRSTRESAQPESAQPDTSSPPDLRDGPCPEGRDPEDPGPDEPADLDERFPPERDPIGPLLARLAAALAQRQIPKPRWAAINLVARPDGGAVNVAEVECEGPSTVEAAAPLLAAGVVVPAVDLGSPPACVATGHDPPPPLADWIKTRDGTCRFPGCRVAARRCDLDHTVRYPDGPTTPDNLAALCRRHHQVKQSGGWSVRQIDAEGTLEWTSPLGRVYRTTGRATTGAWTGARHVTEESPSQPPPAA